MDMRLLLISEMDDSQQDAGRKQDQRYGNDAHDDQQRRDDLLEEQRVLRSIAIGRFYVKEMEY